MYHIRTIKTASGAIAIQVVQYLKRKTVVVKHIGSAHTTEEVSELKSIAQAWIEKHRPQQSLFSVKKKFSCKSSNLLPIDKCRYLGVRFIFVYDILHRLLKLFGFTRFGYQLLNDLVIIRIVEPASKLQSLVLLGEYFDKIHQETVMYRSLEIFCTLKDKVEKKVIALAQENFNFDFSLIFYDVTTVYFESFKSDELRKPGFSKDNKANQPQIVFGLVVNQDGFPVSYEIFEGNKFEGHTFIPVISKLRAKYQIKTLTVVADAAMLSLANIHELQKHGLHYIVGARTGNLPIRIIKQISNQLNQRNGATVRITTEHGQLISGFSSKRYHKNKRELEKQVQKAKGLLKDPSSVKRTKYLKLSGNSKYSLNTVLIEKNKQLLGIKGYYTNLGSKITDTMIIEQYRNLWHVEQSFRIAKSDLQLRPVYHFKQTTIQAHILICFMALALSKYIEIKTGKTIKQIIKLLKGVTDAKILNTLNNEEIILRSEISDEIKQVLQQLNLSH